MRKPIREGRLDIEEGYEAYLECMYIYDYYDDWLGEDMEVYSGLYCDHASCKEPVVYIDISGGSGELCRHHGNQYHHDCEWLYLGVFPF